MKNDSQLLNDLINLWVTPKIGWGQIEDMLNSLAARRGLLTENPNAFNEDVINPFLRYCGRRRLDLDVEQIKDLRLKGLTFRDIAKQLGCSVGVVHKYYRGYVPRRISPTASSEYTVRTFDRRTHGGEDEWN
ncbi:MAG: helix-turn-helix domain-containing protein [Planctomycetaceae bacterium]|nr:helix-turn-helix domain-containing protein [Planctomycetaceae bacterium]